MTSQRVELLERLELSHLFLLDSSKIHFRIQRPISPNSRQYRLYELSAKVPEVKLKCTKSYSWSSLGEKKNVWTPKVMTIQDYSCSGWDGARICTPPELDWLPRQVVPPSREKPAQNFLDLKKKGGLWFLHSTFNNLSKAVRADRCFTGWRLLRKFFTLRTFKTISKYILLVKNMFQETIKNK